MQFKIKPGTLYWIMCLQNKGEKDGNGGGWGS